MIFKMVVVIIGVVEPYFSNGFELLINYFGNSVRLRNHLRQITRFLRMHGPGMIDGRGKFRIIN